MVEFTVRCSAEQDGGGGDKPMTYSESLQLELICIDSHIPIESCGDVSLIS